MKSTSDGAATAPPAGSVEGNEDVLQTLLLPMLLERFDPEQPLTVLDAGFGGDRDFLFRVPLPAALRRSV